METKEKREELKKMAYGGLHLERKSNKEKMKTPEKKAKKKEKRKRRRKKKKERKKRSQDIR